jgi:TM2 domain-containing membrane protein YozV
MDHFYLRSFGTGTQKFFFNIISLGFWYWWDVIQIVADGGKIRKEGLSSPLDWTRGIGRGTFVEPQGKTKGNEQSDSGAPKMAEGSIFAAKRSYVLYAILAIFFGWLGADKFYVGEVWQGLAKLLSCFNIFLFLFGWIWVLWDSFHAFFLTDSILQHGVSVPLPYNWIFTETIPGNTFVMREITKEEQQADAQRGISGMLSSLNIFEFCNRFLGLPIPTLPVREIYREVVAPLMTPPVVAALQSVGHPTPAPPTCLEELQSALPTLPTAQEVHQTTMAAANTGRIAVGAVAEPVAVIAKGVNDATAKTAGRPAMPVQMGGGGGASEVLSGGPGPVIAGVLTAVVLAGGLKGFYDVISKQYG